MQAQVLEGRCPHPHPDISGRICGRRLVITYVGPIDEAGLQVECHRCGNRTAVRDLQYVIVGKWLPVRKPALVL